VRSPEDLQPDCAGLVDPSLAFEVHARRRERLAPPPVREQGALSGPLDGRLRPVTICIADAAAAPDGLDHDRVHDAARSRRAASRGGGGPRACRWRSVRRCPERAWCRGEGGRAAPIFVAKTRGRARRQGRRTQRAPASATERAKAGRSLRKPYRGETRSATVCRNGGLRTALDVRGTSTSPDAGPPRAQLRRRRFACGASRRPPSEYKATVTDARRLQGQDQPVRAISPRSRSNTFWNGFHKDEYTPESGTSTPARNTRPRGFRVGVLRGGRGASGRCFSSHRVRARRGSGGWMLEGEQRERHRPADDTIRPAASVVWAPMPFRHRAGNSPIMRRA